MSKRAVVAVDVGGTTIDAACVAADGEVIGALKESDSPASLSKDEIVNEFARVIAAARARAAEAVSAPDADIAPDADVDVVACGMAIPAPFDYEAGVSSMTHKFQSVYGVPLGDLLREKTGLPAYFVNDADAFGLGVGWRQLPDTKRFVALTIGTGLGGGFIEDGVNVQGGNGVPPGGEVWNLPFGDGILEDHVSARAVEALYGRRGPGDHHSAKEISERAARGEPAALEAYRAMGTALGTGLAPVLARFAPEKIVIGGHIGRSLELFRPAMEQALAAAGLPDLPIIPAAPGNMAIWGAARRAFTLGPPAE
jgi:glucokinase